METQIIEEPKASTRDYSLIGKESETAIQKGLADAQWYTTPIAKDKMNALLVRKNGPAIRDTLLWFSLIIGSGYLVFYFWGSWLAVFPYVVYSVLYASTSDSRWHESSHGTAFKSDWMNNVLYEIASFMVLRQSTVWRYSHTRHHSDTIIRGRDPEIAITRPADILKVLLIFVGISSSIPEFKKIFKHASGRIDAQVASFLPRHEYKRVIRTARIYLLIFATVITLCFVFGTILPILFIGLPTILGSWLMPVYGLTQHAGLAENVLDHRLNCRTVYMNRVHRFLYWNMNYHIEHHMYPLVPYHALPQLHELMKHDCPKPYSSLWQTYREIIPTVLKQAKDPGYYVKRELPLTANHSVSESDQRIIIHDAQVNANKIKLCAAADMQAGEVKRFDYQDCSFALYKLKNSTFRITDGYCTHGNAHLSDGVMIGDLIECAKHNGRFNILDGSPKRPPVCEGIQTYNTVVEDGFVYMLYEAEAVDKKNINSSYKVISNKNLTPWIKELVLQPVEKELFRYQPGQYIKLNIPPHKLCSTDFFIDDAYKDDWKAISCKSNNDVNEQRNYSMAGNPETDAFITLNIRMALPAVNSNFKAGIGSSYVFALKEGDTVKINGPHGDFVIKESQNEKMYIGGGAGMAPIRSHLSNLLTTRKHKQKISFWYGARTLKDAYYQEFFQQLQKKHPNFHYQLALSSEQDSDIWKGYTGNIHNVVCDHYLKEHSHIQGIEFHICGPPPMTEATISMLADLGVKKDKIAFDAF